MNDRILEQQIAQSGDLLDVLKIPAVIKEAIRVEDECKGDIGAGFPAYSHSPKPITPEQSLSMRRKVRLHSLVFQEFAMLIQSMNLNIGTDAAITEGRIRIYQQLKNLSAAQKAYFDALLDEDQAQLSDRPLRTQLNSVLRSLLAASDWSAIKQAAAQAIQRSTMA